MSVEHLHQNELSEYRLVVSDDQIFVEDRPQLSIFAQTLSKLAASDEFRDGIDKLTNQGDPAPLNKYFGALSPNSSELDFAAAKSLGFNRESSRGRAFAAAAGKLHKGVALHKGLHKGLHKSLHKGLHKGGLSSSFGVAAQLDWPILESPHRIMRKLYEPANKRRWDQLHTDGFLPGPVSEQQQLFEASKVLDKQKQLRADNQSWRRERIVIEATNDLTAYMVPLGGDVTSPGSATALLFQSVLALGNAIGQYYKEIFRAPRPNVINPNIEPLIPVPAYYAYPSNHSFQSYLIAEVFARAVPEHSGILALFRAAGAVAENRELAGLHIESDTKAGQTLARLCAPMVEEILEAEILTARKEWY